LKPGIQLKSRRLESLAADDEWSSLTSVTNPLFVPEGRIWIPQLHFASNADENIQAEEYLIAIRRTDPDRVVANPVPLNTISFDAGGAYWPNFIYKPNDMVTQSLGPFIMVEGDGWDLVISNVTNGDLWKGEFRYWEIQSNDPNVAFQLYLAAKAGLLVNRGR